MEAGESGCGESVLKKSSVLRKLFEEKDLVRIMGAHNGLSAKLVEEAGFDGIWASGLEISTAAAVPDASILTMTDYLQQAIEINDAIHIPVVTDCDTGYGNSSNVIRLVQKYEAAGIAGISIEDKMFPKINSLFEGRQELASIGEFVGKILAAKNAQKDPDFMVIARVEALIAGWGMDEALTRSYEYERAGADAILIHHKSSDPAPILKFIKKWNGKVPLVLVPTKYPSLNEKQMKRSGKVGMVIYANHGIRSIIPALRKTYSEIYENGIVSIDERIAPLSDVFELQGMTALKKSEAQFMDKSKEPIKCVIPGAGDYSSETTFEEILRDRPLLLLDVNGKTLVRRSIDSLNAAGIYDITVVAGRHADMIQLDDTKVVTNPDYKDTFIVDSLMRARKALDSRVMIVFSDIVFEPTIIQHLIQTQHDVTIVVDPSVLALPKEKIVEIGPDLVKTDHEPTEDFRFVSSQTPNKVTRIGKNVPLGQANNEFIGIAYFSKEGIRQLVRIYDELKSSPEKQFHEAASFTKASFTDIIQELIERGTDVCALEVRSGWSEIRTFDDYQRISRQLAGKEG